MEGNRMPDLKDKTHRPIEQFDSYLMNDLLRKALPDTYVMLRIASKRAHKIQMGSPSQLPKDLIDGHKPTTIAMMEVEHGIIDESYLEDGEVIEQAWEEIRNPKPKTEETEHSNEPTETETAPATSLDS